jgi:hypothetical protein
VAIDHHWLLRHWLEGSTSCCQLLYTLNSQVDSSELLTLQRSCLRSPCNTFFFFCSRWLLAPHNIFAAGYTPDATTVFSKKGDLLKLGELVLPADARLNIHQSQVRRTLGAVKILLLQHTVHVHIVWLKYCHDASKGCQQWVSYQGALHDTTCQHLCGTLTVLLNHLGCNCGLPECASCCCGTRMVVQVVCLGVARWQFWTAQHGPHAEQSQASNS